MVVLAKDWPSALLAMRDCGVHPMQCIYADDPVKLKGLRRCDVSFLYANNWEQHPNAARLQMEVALLSSKK